MLSKNNSIAILDPNEKRAQKLKEILKGWNCFVLPNQEAIFHFEKPIGILLLNAEIKEISFLIKKAKEKNILKILLLAFKNQETIIGEALNAGANDYLILPVRQHELLTRLHVFWHQLQKSDAPYLKHYDFSFKRYPNRLFYKNEMIKLAPKEFELADLLFHHMDQPLSRAHIAQAVWQMDGNDMLRTIDTHISRVRTKLNLRPSNGYFLEHIYGFGYCLRFLSLNQKDK